MKRLCDFDFRFLRVFFILLAFSVAGFGACELTLDPTKPTVKEGESVRINFSTSGCSSSETYFLRYRGIDSTAKNGSDYTAPTKWEIVKWWYHGDIKGYYDIPITLDSELDDNEHFSIFFQLYKYDYSGKKWSRIQNKNSWVTIKDANAITLHVNSTTVYEGETAKIKMYITGDIPSGQSIDVKYFTANYTASQNINYKNASGTVTFTSTHTEEIIEVQTINDGKAPAKDPLAYHFYFNQLPSGSSNHVDQYIKNVDDFTIGFENISYTGTEGSNLKFVVKSLGNSPYPVEVNYETKNGTAKSGSDYTAKSGTLTFPANISSTTKTIEIPLLSDTETENDEDFSVNLSLASTPATKVTFSREKATGIIKDVDPNKYTIQFSQAKYSGKEGENLNFIVKINKKPTKDITIHYATSPSSATEGADYEAKSGDITFSPTGSLTKTISVPLLKDSEDDEYNEEFYMTLSSYSSSISIPLKQATGVIEGKEFNDADVIDEDEVCVGNLCRSVNLQKDFKLRFGGPGYAVYGDMTATGESVMCPGSRGVCDWDSTTNVEDQPTTKLNEAGFSKNSSYAPLILPDEVDKGRYIAFARLYWQGFVSEKGATRKSALKNYIAGWSSITFQTPDGTNYHLNAKKADTNWIGVWGSGGRMWYQANVDVTDIVRNYMNSDVFQNTKNKRFAAGDIVTTTEGVDTGMVFNTLRYNESSGGFSSAIWGHWGGWTLVVSYDMKKPIGDTKYKNIAIYDGFNLLTPWKKQKEDKIEINVSGFMTPTSGTVDASMTLFSGSGAGPRHKSNGYFELYNPNTNTWNQLYNSLNPYGQPVNGSYTFKDEPLNNNRMNHAATDLDTFNVSKYMSNKQTSAILKLTSYFRNNYGYTASPSLLAFTTEIYSPKVCYEEHIYYKGKEVPTEIVPYSGSEVLTQVEIRNEGYEDAEKIKVYAAFDENYSLEDNSLLFGKTNSSTGKAEIPIANSPLAKVIKPNEFGDSNISMFVGRGASMSVGGTLKAMKKLSPYDGDSAKFDYNMTFRDQNFTEREYHADYVNKALNLVYKGQIFECTDINRNFNTGILGDFNAVSNNPGNGEMKDDAKNSKNSIYMQISKKAFEVYIVSLYQKVTKNSVKKPTEYTGKVKVDLVAAVDYSSCDGKKDKAVCMQDKCENASHDNNISGAITLNFQDDKMQRLEVNVPNASTNLMFRMRYKDSLGDEKCSTSRDSFSIRPETYKSDFKYAAAPVVAPAKFVGGREYTLDIQAVTGADTIKGYSSTTSKAKLNSDFKKIATCALADDNNSATLNFNDGILQGTHTIKTGNIGDYDYSILDNKWTIIDQVKKSNDKEDCIVGSSANTRAGGRYGCNVGYEKAYIFIPLAFRSHLSLQNFNAGSNFTYITSDINMMASFDPALKAVLDDDTADIWDNPVATGYDKSCYAKDISYDMDVKTLPATSNWSRATAAKNDIRYDASTSPFTTLAGATNPAVATTLKDAFTDGVANPNIRFNFTRNSASTDNPFTITRDDFSIINLKDELTPGGYTPEISTTEPASQNINFYYGRVWGPDATGRSPITTRLRYEVYCDGACNTPVYQGIFGTENPISNRWHTNKSHTNLDGTANALVSTGAAPKNSAIAPNPPTLDADGFTNDVDFTANSDTSYTDTININPSPWLTFPGPNPFTLTYITGSNWLGKGQLGRVVQDRENPQRRNHKVEW